jgi:hypothetical protein
MQFITQRLLSIERNLSVSVFIIDLLNEKNGSLLNNEARFNDDTFWWIRCNAYTIESMPNEYSLNKKKEYL